MEIKFIFIDEQEIIMKLENAANFSIKEEIRDGEDEVFNLKLLSLEYLVEDVPANFIELPKKIKVKEVIIFNNDATIETRYANSYFSIFLQINTEHQFIRKIQLLLE